MQLFDSGFGGFDRRFGLIALRLGGGIRRLGRFELVATLIKHLLRQPPLPDQRFSTLKIVFGGRQIAVTLRYERDSCRQCPAWLSEAAACAAAQLGFGFGDEMVATTCPAVTSSPSFTVTVASRPGYFAATSTSVASSRPFDFTIPLGHVAAAQPRNKAFQVFSGPFDRAWLRRLSVCGVNEQRATRNTKCPSGEQAAMKKRTGARKHGPNTRMVL